MDSTDSQISSTLLRLIEEISLFVKCFQKEGEKLLMNCDSSLNFQSIKNVLSQISIEDIGITTKTIAYFFQPQKICGIKVLEEPNASISVFCLSKDMFLSFHDHPHMAVVSKVLFGELERVSVEIVEEIDKNKKNKKKIHINKKSPLNDEKKRFLGNVVQRDVIKANGIIRLTPVIENIHYFKAKTDCILFDVLIPNYDNSYRACHFYKEIGSQMQPNLAVSKKIKLEDEEESFSKANLVEGTVLLEEIEEPPEIQSFVVVAFPKMLSLNI